MVEGAETLNAALCSGCRRGALLPSCEGSLARRGVVKVHWECWSQCNLGCAFCYRSLDSPLNSADAIRMIGLVAFSGVEAIVFAGGDPTLRKDLPELITHASSLGLSVEVQTNAHFLPAPMKKVLLGAHTSLIGLSLDGGSARSHDSMRSTRGNFHRVISLLSQCEEVGKPVIVRTVVTRQNREELASIAKLLSQYANVIRWSLMEFTPIGAGYVNSSLFALSDDDYVEAADAARLAYTGHARVDLFAGSSKMGTYALIKPNGDLYGISEVTEGAYPIVGNFLTDHLSDLADSLPFNKAHHELRYGSRLARELLSPECAPPELE